MTLSADTFQAMTEHAVTAGSTEACGLIFATEYVALANRSLESGRFVADPARLAKALARYGEPQAIFHTHPSGRLELSNLDVSAWYYPASIMVVGNVSGGVLKLRAYKRTAAGHIEEPIIVAPSLV